VKRKTSASPAQGSLAMSTKKPRRRSALTVLFAAAIALLLALPTFAPADPLGSTAFFKTGLRAPSAIGNDVTGPEGNVWFVDANQAPDPGTTTSAIGKITPAGAITEYEYEEDGSELNEEAKLTGIAVGPEGKLWLTDRGVEPGIVVVDPGSPTTATEYSGGLNGTSVPQGIVAGPDGNLWFADSGTTPAIGMINPSNPTEFKKCSIGIAGSNPRGIVSGADGNLWFADTGTRAIGKVNPGTCAVEEFATGENTFPGGSTSVYGPWGIVAGADGNVWFTGLGEENSPAIGRITPSGEITEYGAGLNPKSAPLGLTTAADGKLWFTDTGGVREVQRINLEEGSPWVEGDEFELCGKEPGSPTEKCSKVSYSTETETLQENLHAGVEAIVGTGIGTFVTICEEEPPTRCRIRFAPTPSEGPYTEIDQLTCTTLTGSGTCEGQTLKDGVANAVGSLTYSGEIQRYPINGLEGVAQVAYSGGNVWFPVIAEAETEIGKFGIEEAEPNVKLNIEEGSGTIVSNPAGLECTKAAPGSCEAALPEGKVVLTASPAPGYLVKSWKGCDVGGVNGRQCTVTATSSLKTVGVKFYKVFSLEGSKSGGLGIMGTAPGGINCGYACTSSTALYKEGALTVKAKPAKHFHFVEFKGGTGSASSCNGVTLESCTIASFNSNSAIEEVYAEDAKNTLTLTKEGGGQGFVKTKPTNINCGLTCTSAEAEFFASDTPPEVSVTLGKGTTSVTWTTGAGTCTGNALVCTVPMSASHSLVAKFE
jgi:streptogramin lyase